MIARLANIVGQFNAQARLFFVVVLGVGFAIEGVYTVLLNLYLLRLGYGTEFIGLVNAAGLLAFAFTSLPAGILGARLSNTQMMKIGSGMSLLGGFLLPMAEFAPPGWQQGWLIFHYALLLAGFSVFFVNGAAFLINVVESGQKNDAFALKMAHFSLAAFVGSLVGGMLPEYIAAIHNLARSDPAPYRLTLMLVSLVLAGAFLAALQLRPLSHATPFRWRQPKAKPEARPPAERMTWTLPFITLIGVMTLIRLLQVAGSATAIVYFNVYMDTQLHVPTSLIGAIAALGRLSSVPIALVVPWMTRRWGNPAVIVGASFAAALCLLPLALSESWLPAGLGYIGALAVLAIRYTAFTVYTLELVTKAQQSVMAGSGEMAAGFSFAMMALGGGIILSLFTFRDLFLIGALLSFLGALIFWWYWRQSTKPKRQTAIATSHPSP